MSKVRRVVTGHTEEGKSVIISDTTVDEISLGGGKEFVKIWGSDTIPQHPDKGVEQENLDWFPKPGGHRFFIWVVPPKSNKSKDQKTREEIEQLVPGFIQYFEEDNPGMHTTDCVDCTYLISGSIVLELDDKEEIELKQGDSIVQNGTRHRWHNRSSIPAVLVTTSVGSERVKN